MRQIPKATTQLIPPDHERCQAEKPNGHGSMTLGGSPGRVRCDAKPTVIAVERTAGADGQRGSMSLCDGCRAQLDMQCPGLADYLPVSTQAAP